MKAGAELYYRGLTYWRGLAPRERLIVGGGAVVVTILLLYALFWAPLQRDLERLRTEVPRAEQQLQWMRTQVSRVKQLRAAAPAAVQGQGLLSFVEQSAQAYNIRGNIKRVEPEGSQAVRLVIDGVAFNGLVEWLANLQKQGGIRIESADLEPLPTPGLINARLRLRAPGT